MNQPITVSPSVAPDVGAPAASPGEVCECIACKDTVPVGRLVNGLCYFCREFEVSTRFSDHPSPKTISS